MVKIDRCICSKRPFSELKEVADATSATSVQMLKQHADFGRTCELCHPYVRRMLRTGETSFSQIITDADEPTQSD